MWILTLPSDLRALVVLRSFLEAVCRRGRLCPDTTHAVILATSEAASNVIRHGHQHDPLTPLRVECRLLDDGIEIHIHDEGAPFELASVPSLSPGELRLGGRGVFLMRALMDEITCVARGPRGNTLRMVKRAQPNSLKPGAT